MRLLKNFEKELKGMKNYETLAGAGYKVVRPREDKETLSNDENKKR